MKKFLFVAVLLFSSVFLFANFPSSNAQSPMESSPIPGNASSTSIGSDAANRSDTVSNRSLEFLGQTNITEGAENYERYQSLEAPPPTEIIDKEAIVEQFEEERVEELKESIESLESPLPVENISTFNAGEVIESNASIPTNLSSLSVQREPFTNASSSDISNRTLTRESSQSTTPAGVSTSIAKEWDGLNFRTATRGDAGGVPPDITLAVGPNHVVQMVHSAMRIWDKNGQEIQSVFLDDFFRISQPHSLTDPVIEYDNETGRWFAAIMEISPERTPQGRADPCYYDCYIRIAVSSSDDPTFPVWNLVRVPFGKDLPDYPMIGINNNYYAFGVNIFGSVTGTQAVIMDKNDLIEGTPSVAYYSPIYTDYSTMYPITSDTECMYMQAAEWSMVSGPPFVDGVILVNFCGDPSTNDLNITLERIPIPISNIPVNARQPNNIMSETDNVKPRGPVFFNNTIVSAFHYTCDNEDGIRQTCIRLLKIETGSPNSSTTVSGISANDADVFFPSMSLGKDGKIIMVFGVSSEEIYPSVMIATLDRDLALIETISLVNGDANTNPHGERRPRFGDYFESETDPLDGSVWVAGEYGDSNLPQRWSTYIGNIS
jgi:hypothetical protein